VIDARFGHVNLIAGAWQRSQDDDSAPARITACGKGREHVSRVERKQLSEPLPEYGERSPVRVGRRHEEDEVTVRIVAVLQGQASLEGLAVREFGLGLDPGTPRGWVCTADVRVPGPEVSLDGQWNLRPPAQGCMQALPKAFEQRQLRPVTDRVAGRVSTKTEIQPNDRAPRPDVGDAHPIELASLETPQLAMGGTGRSTSIAQAESGGHPGVAMLLTEASDRIPGPASAAIFRPFSRSHGAEECVVGLHRRSTGVGAGTHGVVTPAGTTSERRPEIGSAGRSRALVVTPVGTTSERRPEIGSAGRSRALVVTPVGTTSERRPEIGSAGRSRALVVTPAGTRRPIRERMAR